MHYAGTSPSSTEKSIVPDLSSERRPRHAQDLASHAPVPARRIQNLLNMSALHVREGQRFFGIGRFVRDQTLQVITLDRTPPAKERRPHQNILQFPDVTRPWMDHQPVHGFLRDAPQAPASTAADLAQRAPRKQGYVRKAVAKWRQQDGYLA